MIDIRNIPIAINDAGESLKDPQFSVAMERADGLIIVVPEYNHGYPEMTIFYDLNFGNVQTLFDESGNLIDKPTYIRRMERFMAELIWMSKVLRYGRQEMDG